MKQQEEQRVAWAFNVGSDARLRGVHLDDNPFPKDDPHHEGWRRGWLDCHSVFGRDAMWPTQDLPRV